MGGRSPPDRLSGEGEPVMGRREIHLCCYCGDPIDPGQEFVYLVEAQEFEERVAPLALVEASPDYHGEPLRMCGACRLSIEQNRRDREEEAARREAQARWARRAFSAMGIALLLFLLACLIADLRR